MTERSSKKAFIDRVLEEGFLADKLLIELPKHYILDHTKLLVNPTSHFETYPVI